MINIQELIIHLQKKITQYRFEQKRVRKGKAQLTNALRMLTQLQGDNRQLIKNTLQNIKEYTHDNMIEVSRYYEKKLDDQKRIYEREMNEMQDEIQRQYSLMAKMKKEVEGLQELIINQNSSNMYIGYSEGKQEHRQQQKRDNILICSPEQVSNHAVNGLEVIEEEETDRTMMSSGQKSAQRNQFSSARGVPQFRQQQQEEIIRENVQRNLVNQFKFSMNNSRKSESYHHSSDESGFFSGCGGYGVPEDEHMSLADFCRRQKTCMVEDNQSSEQYQSLPLSLDDYFIKQNKKEIPVRQQFNTWQGQTLAASLKDITNSERDKQSSQQRQTKTKMFLEEFRKTFNKCLNTAGVCRKQSSKSTTKKKMSTDEKNTSFTKTKELQKTDSQKLISEMLRDIDNNNKFCVGNRRNQIKYDGQKKQSCRSGHGVLYYSNGLCYQGQFKNNMRHGHGILKFNQIQIYRGDWQADELSGQGKLKNFAVINKKKNQGGHSMLSKWISYCGSFKGNRFEGEGTLTLQGNEKFLGKFICGMACGEGTLYRKNGEVQTGIWRNNELIQQF